MTLRFDLTASKRVPFVGTFAIVGPDWSGASYAMQLRASEGSTGTALVSLATASAGSQGISAAYDATYDLPDETTAPATEVTVRISESTIEALSLADPSDEPLELWYDLHITPSGGDKLRYMGGRFFIEPGVTI